MMKKLLFGTLMIGSLAATSMAMQLDLPATNFPGTPDFTLLSAEMIITADGVPFPAPFPATQVAGPDGFPLRYHFMFNYDEQMLPLINDEGMLVRMTSCTFTLNCPNGPQTRTWTVNRTYNDILSQPYVWTSGGGLLPFEECVTELPPACSVNPNILNFGYVTEPDPIQLSFEVCNIGGGTLVGTVTEDCPTFSIVGGADYSLGAGECQNVIVEFVGDHSGPTDCLINVGGCTVLATVDDYVAAVELPAVFALGEAYPNPFNPSTTIAYSVPETQNVKLSVFNTAGQLVQTLVNGTVERGEHKIVFDASSLASGVYVYSLQTDNQSAIKKMVLAK